MNRADILAKIGEIAERAGQPEGIEIVDVELKGGGKHQVLMIVIDKLSGVTHGDCELISKEVGAVLEAEDVIPGTYHLEVSSPGVERKLVKWQDWVRFVNQKVKVVLSEPIEGAKGPLKHFDGVITATDEGSQAVTVALSDGSNVAFPIGQVHRANLKFEW